MFAQLPPVDPPETTPAQLLALQHAPNKLNGMPLSVVTAAGPYTTDDTLDYAVLHDLLDEVKRIKPDVLVLLGPFVDDKHPLIRAGDVSLSADELFRQQISSRLGSVLKTSPATTIILVPSTRDLVSRHCVFPQGPFPKGDVELGLPRAVKLLPNPAVFSINEVAFAVTTVDTLFHLTREEWAHSARDVDAPDVAGGPSSDGAIVEAVAQPDAMARRCRHILRQRSFYPIFPPPAEGANIDAVNLDVSHIDLLRIGNIGADIVILPSVLKHFAKVRRRSRGRTHSSGRRQHGHDQPVVRVQGSQRRHLCPHCCPSDAAGRARADGGGIGRFGRCDGASHLGAGPRGHHACLSLRAMPLCPRRSLALRRSPPVLQALDFDRSPSPAFTERLRTCPRGWRTRALASVGRVLVVNIASAALPARPRPSR